MYVCPTSCSRYLANPTNSEIFPPPTVQERAGAMADVRALRAPPKQWRSPRSLVQYLCEPFGSRGGDSDRDRARAIFRWITANIS